MTDPSTHPTSPAPATEDTAPEVTPGLLTRGGFLKVAAATGATLAAGTTLAGVAKAAPAFSRLADTAELDFWHFKPELRPNIQAVIDAFQKDFPNIRINQIPKPTNNYPQVLSTAAAAGELPDLFFIDVPHVPY